MILKSVLFKAVHLCSALSSGDLSISLPLSVEADLVDMSCHDVLYIYNTGHFYLVSPQLAVVERYLDQQKKVHCKNRSIVS